MFSSISKEKKSKMNELAKEAESCLGCDLSKDKNKIVIGAGNLDAKIVLVGEAPGKKEDETGLPFVGSAGKLLDEILEDADLSRDEVFITNILKCRPPNNRRPKKIEVESCEDLLMRQLSLIQPKVIAPMGNSSLSFFQEKYSLENGSIGDIHGTIYEVEASWNHVKIVPLYHPAAAIYRRFLLDILKEDMKKIAEI